MAADAGRPLRAAEFAVAAGLGTNKAKVESLRSKLKLLAGRGWLAGAPGGLFTLRGCTAGENSETRTVTGSSSLGSKVLLHPNLKEEEPSWQRTPRFPLMIRSPPQGSVRRAGRRARRARRGRPDGLPAGGAPRRAGPGGAAAAAAGPLRPAPGYGRTESPRAPCPGDGDGRDHPDPAGGRARQGAGHPVRRGAGHPVRLAKPGAANFCPADAALSLPAGRQFPLPGQAGRDRGGPRLLRRGARRGHPALRPGHRQAAGRAGRGGAAADIPAFYAARVPEPCTPGRCWSCPPTARAS